MREVALASTVALVLVLPHLFGMRLYLLDTVPRTILTR
jgi:hypothetical protein